MGTLEKYTASVAMAREALFARPEMRDYVRYATLAPNGHSTQPWRFLVGNGRIEIRPDFSRRIPIVDGLV
jgi:nitroreductase